MYYVKTKRGGGSRKWQFLITFSTESNHKGEERGGGFRKPQILLRNTWMVPYLEPFSMLGLSLHNEAFTVFEQSRTTNAWCPSMSRSKIFLKNVLKNKEIVFKNGVQNKKATAYNCELTVFIKRCTMDKIGFWRKNGWLIQNHRLGICSDKICEDN